MTKSPFQRRLNRQVSVIESRSEENTKLATELRDSINGSLINVGVLAALMMALAGAIYVDPPEPPGKCFGEGMLNAEMTLAWMAMGFFFFSTLASVVFYMDIDGIPPKLLLQHLWDSQILYSLPTLAIALGIFMTAMAYGIDIGERGGCKFFIFGVIAAPCFVGAIVVLWLVCWHRRKKLFEKNNFSPGGCSTEEEEEKTQSVKQFLSSFSTWAERIPTIAIVDGEPA